MAGGRDNERYATLIFFLWMIDEEIKSLLQQDDVETSAGNTVAQKYVEEIKLHVDQQMRFMKFYIET